ncbi:Ig-like domain-containing protein [Formosa sp. PL04]|uniref:Ig-like domain-containing protein n=1 Tax=Formosa sp. PL04 TaxID=3081755 RepID=UPI002981F2B5|nr:Ig-like domain-containing protein [Formosa sp. PL04]MDW5290628.1 Ig-like domain-containing protein [Formosa sp. PL04]
MFITVLCLTIINCANKGNPTGGKIDTTPPAIVKSQPENFSTQFKSDEIRIYFNEYIKIKNLSKQLIISPPMNTQPDITPLGSASKYITIKIYDTLIPNTTYAINFGSSIVDNHEENPFPYYKYVFSTGDYIDSLQVAGVIMDATLKKPDNFVTVALYEIDSTFTDSIIFKEKPKYVTNTLDSITTFNLENIKAGKYLLVAMKDENQDYKFQPKSDKIGFLNSIITVPTDTIYHLKLFKEELEFKPFKPRLVSKGKIAFGFEGDYENMDIDILTETPPDFEHTITKEEKTDSLLYWYRPKLDLDTLRFKVGYKHTAIDTFSVKITDKYQDSLIIKGSHSGQINFNDDFILTATTPFKSLDKSHIFFIDKDSIVVPYTTKMDTLNNNIKFSFKKKENLKYRLQLFPGAITDFFDNKNDTLQYLMETRAYDDYPNVRIIIKNAEYPLIIQLTTESGEVKYEQYSTEPEPVDFTYLAKGKYWVRVIYDTNKNKKYSTGNVLKKIQPERISYYPEEIDVRAGFDSEYEFILK